MVNLSIIQNAPLKVVFLIHFILSTWGMQGYWSPQSYLFYNIIFLLTILWSIHHKESDEPVMIALAVGASSILMDVIVLCTHFPSASSAGERFSGGMAILNLLVRPLTLMILYRTYSDRAELLGTGLGIPEIFGRGGNVRSPYQDIDHVHQSIPRTEIAGSTMFEPSSSDNKMPPPYHG